MTSQATAVRRRQQAMQIAGWTVPDFSILADREHLYYENHLFYTMNYASCNMAYKDVFDAMFYWVEKNAPRLSLAKVPDWEFHNLGKYAWILNEGGKLPDDTFARFKTEIVRLVKKYEHVELEKRPAQEPTVIRTNELIGELDGVIDDVISRKAGITQPFKLISAAGRVDLDEVQRHFAELLFDLTAEEEYFKANPEDLTSPYTNKLEKLAIGVILTDIEKARGAKTHTRPERVRKPRKINPEKAVKKLNYMKDFPELSLKSIDPKSVIGCEVLWVYNTKKRRLGKYVAQAGQTLTIKGSTILNYEPSASIGKTLRKPAEHLTRLIHAGKVEQRRFLEQIGGMDKSMNGRINNDTILLKAT